MADRFDRPLTGEERDSLRARAAECPRRPGLAVVCLGVLPDWVGEDCAACGIYCERYALPVGMGETDVRELAGALGARADLDAVVCLTPSPEETPLGWARTLERVLELARARESV